MGTRTEVLWIWCKRVPILVAFAGQRKYMLGVKYIKEGYIKVSKLHNAIHNKDDNRCIVPSFFFITFTDISNQ